MPKHEAELGGRLLLADPAALSPAQLRLWERMDATMGVWASQVGFQARTVSGQFIGPFNPMLQSPELASRFLELQLDERQRSRLCPRLREVVILSVGSVWRADYEVYAHSASARAQGLAPEAIAALAAGHLSEALTPREAVTQRLTLALIRDCAVDDDLYREGLDALGEGGLVDLVILVGCYELVCSLLNLFAIPAPASETKE